MPDQEVAFIPQTALLWEFTGRFNKFGQFQVASTPVEIPVRWLTDKREAMDANGNTISLDGTAVVDRDIPVGSHMWLGTLDDWFGTGSGSGSIAVDEEVMEVKANYNTPDIKGRAAFREVGLMRFRNIRVG